LWVRGLPLTVPMHAGYARRSPYTLRVRERGAKLYYRGEEVGPVAIPPRPRIYDLVTADGVPYWKIALLHLDSIASTVVQKCIYWGTPEQCGFCGIELTRGEQTIPVKTPAQLAEVCAAARELDGAVDATLTTGSLNRRDRGALYLSKCAEAIKEASGLPIQVQFEPPDDLDVLEHGRDHLDAGAGCARCQACSGLSAWERVFRKEELRERRRVALRPPA